MNDYDDSEDYSSANSFRARSNTWPLNRPDFAVPTGVCVDETLPEIELEDDDLFTTNENWSTGLVDHDIMSWDPILNAQSQQQQQQYPSSTIHHHQQQPLPQQEDPQQQQQHQHGGHQRQPSLHHHPQHLQRQHDAQQQQPHDPTIIRPTQGSTVIVCNNQQGMQASQLRQANQQQQQQQHHHHHHQTLNNSHYLDQDDPSDYHIHQLHHLHLDNPGSAPEYHYVSPSSISPNMCAAGPPSDDSPTNTTTTNNNVADSYHLTSDHQHNLQQLTSARYDLDAQCDPDYDNHADILEQNHHQHHHQHHHQQQHQQPHHHHQHHHHNQHPHQLHQLTSSSLDNHTGSTHMLSSSLNTSGICLSGDLEDLDYKPIDPTAPGLQNSHYADQLGQDQLPSLQSAGDLVGLESVGNNQQLGASSTSGVSNNVGATNNKQSSSTTSSKSKQNTPRRNAWGNMSYADLISQAINSTNDKRLTLSQIYEWMVQHVPYFKDKGDSNSSAGWKNSVRHNLSLHSRFKRLQNEGTGKSSWWTINPEANVGKCARRRAASMEASKFEKKRGRAKKRAEAVRQGLISYPSLTNSSLNGSTSALEPQLPSQLQPPQSTTQYGPQQQTQQLDQFEAQQPQQQHHHHQQQQPLQSQSISQFNSELQPQQQILSGPHSDSHNRQPDSGLYVASSIKSQYELDPRYTIVMSK